MKRRLFVCCKRALSCLLSVFLLSVAVFTISRLAPGDPLMSYYGERVEKMSEAEKKGAREKLGLHDPMHVQYIRWLENAVQGDFGISYKYKQAVTEVIGQRIGNTLILCGTGFVLVFFGALGLGMACAWREDSLLDRIVCKSGTLFSCIPEFWLALLLILVFSVLLPLLPSSGAYAVGQKGNVLSRIEHLILPLSVVVLSHLWYYAYMVRNKLLEETREDHVLLAKAKGLSRGQIFCGHCLRNIFPYYISTMALAAPHILGGSYIVEMVFSYPGIGTLSYESARYHDYNLLMVLCLLTGILVIGCNLIGNLVSETMDPRIRARQEDREEVAHR